MDDLKVPKQRVLAEVAQTDGSVLPVQLFVSQYAMGSRGPERPSEALLAARFLPAIDRRTDALVCLNRDGIVWMKVEAALEPPGPEAHTIPTEHEVEVVLTGGHTCEGLLSYVRPAGQARLSDFLNDERELLRLLDGPDVLLLNTRHVLRVVSRRP